MMGMTENVQSIRKTEYGGGRAVDYSWWFIHTG